MPTRSCFPEGFTTTAPPLETELENGDEQVAEAPTTTIALTAPEIAAESVEAVAIDATVPPAVSESGRAPAYGGGNPTIGLTEALNVTMPSVNGGLVDVSQYLGQDVVLWFWAPWCSWCNAEAPRINAMTTEYGEEVEIVGVAGVSEFPEMVEFVERHGLEHVTHLADTNAHFWASLDVSYQPWWIFINDTGEVVLNWQGRLTEDEIREVMDILIAA